MVSKIGNRNDDERGFELECILCGRGEGVSLIAHRNNKNIVGFIAACRDCKGKIYGGGFQLYLPKSEVGNDDMNADPYNLSAVVMPLVRIMKDCRISWADRTDVAWAIVECLREHKSLIDERDRILAKENCGTTKE